jgi:hypothetical protein
VSIADAQESLKVLMRVMCLRFDSSVMSLRGDGTSIVVRGLKRADGAQILPFSIELGIFTVAPGE